MTALHPTRDTKHPMHSEAQELGHEGRAGSGDHAVLKLWLRLLASTTQIEAEIRRRLRERFDISLARFDYMAQLYRYREGLRMRVLSRYLMVTGGNVTGLADELEKEGLVERIVEPHDRRSSRVTLTKKGRRLFDRLAAMHEAWIVAMFGGMSTQQLHQLHDLLGALRVQLAGQQEPAATPVAPTRRPRRTRATT